jgi:hypothetical protein
MATVGLSVDSSSAQSLLDQLFNELYVNEKDEIAYKSWFRFDHLLPVFSSYMRIGELTSEEKNKLIRSCITQT